MPLTTKRATLVALFLLAIFPALPAQTLRPTLSGRLQGREGPFLRVQLGDGQTRICRWKASGQASWRGRTVSLNELPVGEKMVFGVAGSLAAQPLLIDRICDQQGYHPRPIDQGTCFPYHY